MTIHIASVSVKQVQRLFELHHDYKSVGGAFTYLFGAIERGKIVAAFAWQPPAAGCAKSVLVGAPYGVLSLSRMVAVPKADRELKHISKPLRHQMKHLIDRGRWPALVTFSDEGLGHTGHVYKCSGWQKTTRKNRRQFVDKRGRRVSPYSNGKQRADLISIGSNHIQRWEHHIIPPEQAEDWIIAHGWRREPIPGKVWASGNQAHRVVKRTNQIELFK